MAQDELPITMADVWGGLNPDTRKWLLQRLMAMGKVPQNASIGSLALMRVIDVLTLVVMPNLQAQAAPAAAQARAVGNAQVMLNPGPLSVLSGGGGGNGGPFSAYGNGIIGNGGGGGVGKVVP